MEWFHCNDCYKQDRSKSVFVLLPCGRILCSDCLSRNSCTGKPCQKCRANGYTNTTLKNDLPADVADFFRNPNFLLKKYIKVIDFQKRHQDSIFNFMTKECHRLSAEYQKVRDTSLNMQQYSSDSLAQENETLKTAVRNLHEELERLKAATGQYDRSSGNQWNRHHFNPQVAVVQTPAGPAADNPAASTRLSTPAYPAPAKRTHGNSGKLSAAKAAQAAPNYGSLGSKRSTPSHPPAAKKTTASKAPPISRLVQNTPAFYHSTPLPPALPPLAGSTHRLPAFQSPLPPVNSRLPLVSTGYLPPSAIPVAGYIPRTNPSVYSFERVFSFMSSASKQAKTNLDKKTPNRQ